MQIYVIVEQLQYQSGNILGAFTSLDDALNEAEKIAWSDVDEKKAVDYAVHATYNSDRQSWQVIDQEENILFEYEIIETFLEGV